MRAATLHPDQSAHPDSGASVRTATCPAHPVSEQARSVATFVLLEKKARR
jgi:hypothetical protein